MKKFTKSPHLKILDNIAKNSARVKAIPETNISCQLSDEEIGSAAAEIINSPVMQSKKISEGIMVLLAALDFIRIDLEQKEKADFEKGE